MPVLTKEFFSRDVLSVAPELVGKNIVRILDGGEKIKLRITETECYRGEEDTACHASKGRTPRTEILYGEPGVIYVYLCYGIHFLMNIVTGEKGFPQGVLLRACEGFEGPARLTKKLAVDKSFNGMNIYNHPELWIEDDGFTPNIITMPRIGISYATPEFRDIKWRFVMK